ncbi:MAG: hypothetical protein DMF95_35060 [Acidobacteria bacterium]|nr:MAG: hypothetical protein DMF95_35060 [Acidobacteriota bacterium]
MIGKVAFEPVTGVDETTFVLGAGFSADQGFPLARDLRPRVLHFLEAERHPSYETFLVSDDIFPGGQFYEALGDLDPIGKLGFEELLIQLRKRAQQGDQSLNPLDQTLRIGVVRLIWCVTHANRHPEKIYLNCAKRWASASNCHVVSFNWDLLPETCLTRVGGAWSYTLAKQGTPILKPHGSVNWTSVKQHPELTSGYGGWVGVDPASTVSYDGSDPLANPFEQEINSDLRYCVYPGDPDAADTHPDVALLWRDVRQAISVSDRVVFIGYSLPDYDNYSADVLSHACSGKVVEVWDPSKHTLDRYAAIFANSELHEATFGQTPYAS